MTEEDIPVIRRSGGPCSAWFDPSWIASEHRPRAEALVIWTIYAAAFGVAFCSFARFHKHPGFKPRSPYLTMFGSICGFLMVTVFLAEQWFRMSWRVYADSPLYAPAGVNDAFLVLNYAVCTFGFVLFYCLRAIRLLVIFRKQAFRLKSASNENATSTQSPQLSAPLPSPTSQNLPAPIPNEPSSPGIPPSLTPPLLSEGTQRKTPNTTASFCTKIFGSGPSESKFFAVGIALLLLSFLINWADGVFSVSCKDADFRWSMYAVFILEYVIVLIVLGATLILLRNVHDAFTINSELRVVITITFLLGIPWAILALNESLNAVRPKFPPSYLLVILSMILTLMSLLMPVTKLLRPDSVDVGQLMQKLAQSNRIGATLDSVLEDKIAMKYFMRYLQTELSTENLSFWKEIKHYKRVCSERSNDPLALAMLADDIFAQYISNYSETQVNVSGENVELVAKELLKCRQRENCTAERLTKIFDNVLNEVEISLRMDSFPRFQGSAIFKEMCRDIHSTDLDALRDAHVVEMITQTTVHAPPPSH